MKINLIALITLISKQIPIIKFLKLGLGTFLGQLEIIIIRNLALLLFAYLLICLLHAPSAYSQTQKGITVFPSIMHLDLASDPPEYELTYINNTNTEINLLLSAQDFSELEDSYKINFLEGKDATNYKYSLSSWISFENKNIQLAPNERKSVKIFIDNKRITKGGHYASILAEIIQPQTKKEVTIKAILSTLLFVRASTGLEIEDGKISSLKTSRDGIEHPEAFVLRFQNNGNVHVIPYGLIEVFDPFGNKIAGGILNEGSLDALPESIRRYEIKTKTESKLLMPGFYKAKIAIHYGKTNQKINGEIKFLSQGSFNFALIGMILILGVLLIIYYKKRSKS